MKTYETTGFVLSRKNFGEGDLLIQIFTREQGRIKVVARGARKAKAKLRSHLEPFVMTDFRLVAAKGMDIIIGAQNQQANPYHSANLEQKTAAYVLTEAIAVTTAEEQSNAQVFKLYSTVLQQGLQSTDPQLTLCFGLLHLLKTEGIEPELPTEPLKKFFFNLDSGVVSPTSDGVSITLNLDTVKLWKTILNYNLATVSRIKANPELLSNSVETLVRYMEYHFHTRLKSLKVFQDTAE